MGKSQSVPRTLSTCDADLGVHCRGIDLPRNSWLADFAGVSLITELSRLASQKEERNVDELRNGACLQY